MTVAAELRRLADDIEPGKVEAPGLVYVSRIYYGAAGEPTRTATDYMDAAQPGAPLRWDEPHAARARGPMSLPDDGA
jgi:hypothetical protein